MTDHRGNQPTKQSSKQLTTNQPITCYLTIHTNHLLSHHPFDRPTNHSTIEPTLPTTNQLTHQPTNQPTTQTPTKSPTKHSTNSQLKPSINHRANGPINNQPTVSTNRPNQQTHQPIKITKQQTHPAEQPTNQPTHVPVPDIFPRFSSSISSKMPTRQWASNAAYLTWSTVKGLPLHKTQAKRTRAYKRAYKREH